MEGFNNAFQEWRIEDAQWYAKIAAVLHPNSGVAEAMKRHVDFMRERRDGEWVLMVDSAVGNREYVWFGPPSKVPPPAPPLPQEPKVPSRRFSL